MASTYDPTLPTARDRLRHDLNDFDVSLSPTGGIGPVTILTAGTGYSAMPSAVFTGGTPTTTAAGRALPDGAGGVASVVMDNPGAGYATLPSISFIGGTGSGVTAVASFLTNALQPDSTYDEYLTLYGEDEGKWRMAAFFLAYYAAQVDSVGLDDGTRVAWRQRAKAWETIVATWFSFAGSYRRGTQRPLVGQISTVAPIDNPGTSPFDANSQNYRGSAYPRYGLPDG